MFDIWHVAFPVRDLNLSVKYYRDFLGWELIGYHDESGRKQAFVKIPNRSFTIELFLPRLGDDSKIQNQKPYHLAFECENLTEFRASLVAKTADYSIPQVLSFSNGVKHLGLVDPDGVPLEFFEGRSTFDRSIADSASRA